MKPLREMTDRERTRFLLLGNRVLKTLDEIPCDVPPAYEVAITLLCILTDERPDRNLWVAYDVDRESFLRDAIRLGVLYYDNLNVLFREHPALTDYGPAEIDEALESVEFERKMLFSRFFEPLLKSALETYFSGARKRGVI